MATLPTSASTTSAPFVHRPPGIRNRSAIVQSFLGLLRVYQEARGHDAVLAALGRDILGTASSAVGFPDIPQSKVPPMRSLLAVAVVLTCLQPSLAADLRVTGIKAAHR